MEESSVHRNSPTYRRLTHAQPCVMFVLFYNGSEEEGKAYFQPFFDLSKRTCPPLSIIIDVTTDPVINTCAEVPYEAVNGLQVSLISIIQISHFIALVSRTRNLSMGYATIRRACSFPSKILRSRSASLCGLLSCRRSTTLPSP